MLFILIKSLWEAVHTGIAGTAKTVLTSYALNIFSSYFSK